MAASHAIQAACVFILAALASAPAVADERQPVELTIAAGHTARLALDQRVTVKGAGQTVTGTLVEPIYAYDRVVVPAGATVRGHIQSIQSPPRMQRARAWLSGELTPNRQVTVRFDRVVLADGSDVALPTEVTNSAERVSLRVAGAGDKNEEQEHKGVPRRAKDEASQRARQMKEDAIRRVHETLALIKGPDKVDRLKAAAIQRLPYHRQYLSKGSVYTVAMTEPMSFGSVLPASRAPAGTMPQPDSVLNARLVTALDSTKTLRGSAVTAVVTEPVFTSDHELIVPEGSTLVGEVTFAKPARRFHRNGQLRFLIESLQSSDTTAAPLLASLSSIQLNDSAAVEVDEEGGAKATESKTRFIPPALAALALTASLHREPRRMDNDADDSLPPGPGGNPASFGVGGFLGWGALGAAVSQVSHPLAIGISAVGVVRTVYSSVFGKGRDVVFPANTPIQVQLAPGPDASSTSR